MKKKAPITGIVIPLLIMIFAFSAYNNQNKEDKQQETRNTQIDIEPPEVTENYNTASDEEIPLIEERDYSSPEMITKIQQGLADAGFYSGSIDGDAGSMTQSAVAAYRSAAGLPDGVEIDDDVYYKLLLDVNHGLPVPAPTETPTKPVINHGNQGNPDAFRNMKEVSTDKTYIVNLKTGIIHNSWCSSGQKVGAENRLETNESLESLLAKGYKLCGMKQDFGQ